MTKILLPVTGLVSLFLCYLAFPLISGSLQMTRWDTFSLTNKPALYWFLLFLIFLTTVRIAKTYKRRSAKLAVYTFGTVWGYSLAYTMGTFSLAAIVGG